MLGFFLLPPDDFRERLISSSLGGTSASIGKCGECMEYIKIHCLYLRVPSKRVAIVSKNVFWGANSPRRAGIERPVIRRI